MIHAEIYEAFFFQADVDCDGVVSGFEAVNFFKDLNIPQPILAKIWKFADEGQRGFLSRQEFYNALKLVTIAQTGRELTPELVKEALRGTAASQIPPPKLTSTRQFSNIKKEGLSQPPFLPTTSNLGIKEHIKARPFLEAPWPKMTTHDVQRYIYVFNKIDTDEDGKISGHQTRNLFLSWQLPTEVLKNAWTLSDQDGDNMLSKREFCIMVYLLEKFTEGFSLPSKVPMDIQLDEALAFAKNEATKSINLPPNFQFIDKDKESKESSTPTLTSSGKSTMQIMSQKNKAQYYYSKLQEIEVFKNQCDNKFAKMIEEIIEYKNEVNSLSQQCDLKSKFALKGETIMSKENATTNENLILFDVLEVELNKLKKMLVEKANSLGVDIKQELPEKILFDNLKASKSLLKVEIGSTMINETIKANESVTRKNKIISNVGSNPIHQWKEIQDDITSFEPQTLWSVQKNCQSIQNGGVIKKLKSRGSFEPEDYFDFTQLHDLMTQSPSNEGLPLAFDDHIRANHQETCPNYLLPQK